MELKWWCQHPVIRLSDPPCALTGVEKVQRMPRQAGPLQSAQGHLAGGKHRVQAIGWQWEIQKRKLTDCTFSNAPTWAPKFCLLSLCLGPTAHRVPLDLCICSFVYHQTLFKQGPYPSCRASIPNSKPDSWQIPGDPRIGMDKELMSEQWIELFRTSSRAGSHQLV